MQLQNIKVKLGFLMRKYLILTFFKRFNKFVTLFKLNLNYKTRQVNH